MRPTLSACRWERTEGTYPVTGCQQASMHASKATQLSSPTCGKKNSAMGGVPRTVPLPTVHSPAIMRSGLDLPQPEGSITSKDSPAGAHYSRLHSSHQRPDLVVHRA
jgi:hypothetical protein